MSKIYKSKILDIKHGTLDHGDVNRIIDAYVKLEVNGIKFWCFVYEGWTTGKWSLSMKGETVPLKFVFLNIPERKTRISDKREKKITPVQNQKKPCDYILIGEIINKEPHPELPDREKIQLDFGVITKLSSSTEKNKFKIGDYIEAVGRLDAHKVKEAEGG